VPASLRDCDRRLLSRFHGSTTTPPSGPLTPEMVQKIVQALSAAGLSGTSLRSPWYFDSGASNHIKKIPRTSMMLDHTRVTK